MTGTDVLDCVCCADRLVEPGRFPTIGLTRERIGIDGLTTIKRAINDWTLQSINRKKTWNHA